MSVVRRVILCSRDLLLVSSVGAAAREAGAEFRAARSADEAASFFQEQTAARLLLDLGSAADCLTTLTEGLPAAVLTAGVAFGPHVQAGILAAARQAGFGTVCARGHFVSHLAAFMASGPIQNDPDET